MSDTTTRYRPRAYRRVCDVCGMLRNIDDMHKQDDLWVCTYDAGERVRTELDRGNARQRPFQIRPVPHPKPQDHYYPNLLETDDAAVFNFLAQQVASQCRYEMFQVGAAAATAFGDALPGLSWAARYFYDLIQENSRRLLIDKAKELLATIANYLLTRQYGSLTGPSTASTQANDPFFGAFLETGGTVFVTDDTSTCGLALLYAYRIHGTASYLVGARSAASFLRNIQAIGSHGYLFTSSNPTGTGHLYTGGLLSETKRALDIDLGVIMYPNHLFYPGSLVGLEFWNELKITDGDQSVGATAIMLGAFPSIPAQTLSQSILDLRGCWETGIIDSAGALINGLSDTTPREYFNAYPAIKPFFTTITGTGAWEYADGGAANGTQVSAQNFAMALSSLYNYEGATAQVTGISDWLRTFTSNPDFETPDGTTPYILARTTTGTYDPTLSLATLLTVRDEDDSYAAIKINGSSLYDWGAFGMLSRLWASRYTASFRNSRLYPLNTNIRFNDGTPNDYSTDRIILRGLCGLTFQTAFAIDVTGAAGAPTPYPIGTPAERTGTPPLNGMWLWLKADEGVNLDMSGFIGSWDDQSGNDHGPTVPGVSGPTLQAAAIDGLPAVRFDGNQSLDNLVDNIPPGTRTIFAVARPNDIEGGALITFRRGPAARDWCAYGGWFFAGIQYVWTDAAINIAATAAVDYSTAPHLFEHTQNGSNSLTFKVDAASITLTSTSTTNENSDPGFSVGGRAIGGYLQGWLGIIAEIIVWTRDLSASEILDVRGYVQGRYPSIPQPAVPSLLVSVVNDAVRAAQYGRSFRESRS